MKYEYDEENDGVEFETRNHKKKINNFGYKIYNEKHRQYTGS